MCCATAGKAAIRVQALQYEGRRRVLARLKISSRSIAPDGKPWGRQRFTNLVQDWGKTRWQRLNIQQRRVRAQSGRCRFIPALIHDCG